MALFKATSSNKIKLQKDPTDKSGERGEYILKRIEARHNTLQRIEFDCFELDEDQNATQSELDLMNDINTNTEDQPIEAKTDGAEDDGEVAIGNIFYCLNQDIPRDDNNNIMIDDGGWLIHQYAWRLLTAQHVKLLIIGYNNDNAATYIPTEVSDVIYKHLYDTMTLCEQGIYLENTPKHKNKAEYLVLNSSNAENEKLLIDKYTDIPMRAHFSNEWILKHGFVGY